MPKFKVTEEYTTYATTEIEARDEAEALAFASAAPYDRWSYMTDFDTPLSRKIEDLESLK